MAVELRQDTPTYPQPGDVIEMNLGGERKFGEVVISNEEYHSIIKRLAKELHQDFKNQPMLLVNILTAAYTTTSDLGEALWEEGYQNVFVGSIGVDTYDPVARQKYQESQINQVRLPGEAKDGMLIVISDLIGDSGGTVEAVEKYLRKRFPNSKTKIVIVVNKEAKKTSVRKPDYVGKNVPDWWLFGKGADGYNGMLRNTPFVGRLIGENEEKEFDLA